MIVVAIMLFPWLRHYLETTSELWSSYLNMAHMLMFGETLHFATQLNYQMMLVLIQYSFYSDTMHM